MVFRGKQYCKFDVRDFELIAKHLVEDTKLEIIDGRYVDDGVHRAFLEFLEFEWQVCVNCGGEES